jgi:hypothetical protein
MTTRRPATYRRDSAPIRKRRRATTIPDFLFAVATAAVAMAGVFVVATYVDDSITAGETGAALARLFAAALAVAGCLLFLLGMVLLRDDRGQADHYAAPMAIGILVGVVEAVFLLVPFGAILWLPPLFLLFALRPVRSGLTRMTGGGKR